MNAAAAAARPRPGAIVAAAALGYAAGLLPSADLAARAATGGAVDLRSAGSGNPGGANAGAVLGRRWGAAVMAADVLKGVVACRVARRVAGDVGQHVAGVAAVVGHCYPVTARFRGGKGVATGVGQCAATLPYLLPIEVAVAGAASRGPWRDRALAATVAASVTWVVGAVTWWRLGLPNAWGGRPSMVHPLAALGSSAVIARRFGSRSWWPASRR